MSPPAPREPSSRSTARPSPPASPSASSSGRARAPTRGRRRTRTATCRPRTAARSSSTRWPSSTSPCSPSCCACSRSASHPRKVDVRVCAATLKDLRAEVTAGRFREDLYYRIGRPEVRLPALVERLEEVPFHIVRELVRVDPRLTAHPSLIEACVLRAWPGNVRELLGEIRRAGRDALADNRTAVKDKDLAESAGREMSDGRRVPA